jgi:DNA-binding winged helix-turn-helix (wHTH) protein
VPILMLTAKEAIEDRVAGLDAGADDYLVKPFAFDELMARVRALLRRAQPNLPQVYRFADLELDTGTRQGRRGGVTFDLTAKEYELLELFMRHPRQVLTRDVIFDRVWNYDFGGESNIIEVYVRYLRQKTEQGGMLRLIHTVRGIGYVLREGAQVLPLPEEVRQRNLQGEAGFYNWQSEGATLRIFSTPVRSPEGAVVATVQVARSLDTIDAMLKVARLALLVGRRHRGGSGRAGWRAHLWRSAASPEPNRRHRQSHRPRRRPGSTHRRRLSRR